MSLFEKFPSYDLIINNCRETIARFPFAVLCSFVGSAIALYLVEHDTKAEEHFLSRVTIVLALGFIMFIALKLFSEVQKLSKTSSLLIQLGGILLLVLYYFTIPTKMFEVEMHGYRYLLLMIGMHFLIAFIPYYKSNLQNGFWQYNKTLFLRFLTASLFTAVLYIGLSLAILSFDHLFGVDIDEEIYLQLWIIVVGIIHPLLFLSGMPKNFEDLENNQDFPRGLRVFTQYILLPLVVLYFVILIIYEGKILFTWNWPKGWVGHLVLWYSVVSILSLLLLYPLQRRTDQKWIKIFSTWFFRALIPLLIMLFISIYKRISEYGVTENRYFVFAMAIGLSIVVIYFIFSKSKHMKIIPIVLCLLAFGSSFGPWGAFSISERSQKARLNTILNNLELLDDNKIIKASTKLTFDDRKDISSIISYLIDHYGLNTIEHYFVEEFADSLDTLPNYNVKQEITQMIGFDFIYRWDYPGLNDENMYYTFRLQDQSIIDIAKYDQLIELEDLTTYNNESTILLQHDTCTISLIADSSILILRFRDETESRSINLQDNIIEMSDRNYDCNFSQKYLIYDFPGENPNASILIKSMNGYYAVDSIPSIISISYHLLINNSE